jgi:transcriptional regulator with XRE-family HTH domain
VGEERVKKITARRRLGKVIHERRTELRLSQSTLAERVQLRQQAISDIESGKQAIPADELPAWAKALEFKTVLPFFDQTDHSSLWELMD